MRNTFRLLVAVALLFSVMGCGRKYHLKRDVEISPSNWPLSRHDLQSTGMMECNFKGNLNHKWSEKVSGSPIGPMSIGADKIIICASNGRVHFIDKDNGHNRGRLKYKGIAQTGLTVIDSLAYFAHGPDKNRFLCLNLHNHRNLWKANLKDVTGPPIIIDNRIYLADAFGRQECRDRMTGEIIWSDTTEARSPAGPSYDDGIIYFPFDDGELRGYDALTGELIFSIDLDEPLLSKTAIDNLVFVAGAEGAFTALDKKTGDIIWQKIFEWPIWTAPAVDEGMVYIGDNGGHLRALDKTTGRTVWTFKSNGVILASPIALGDFLLFASLDRYLYCLDKKTGLLSSKWKTRHEVRFPPISDGESIYIAAHDGTIYCFGD